MAKYIFNVVRCDFDTDETISTIACLMDEEDADIVCKYYELKYPNDYFAVNVETLIEEDGVKYYREKVSEMLGK